MSDKRALANPNQSFLMSSNLKMVMDFVLPTIILFTLSDESRLGPLYAMLLALASPLVLELYKISKKQKPSIISVLAIIGILSIGGISLFELSEGWLAVRRSITYVVIALGIFILMRFRRKTIDAAVLEVIDMDSIHAAAKQKGVSRQITRHTNNAIYLFALLLLIIGIANYFITLLYITYPTDTSGFNKQYAELRLLSILFFSVPLLIGTLSILFYFVNRVTKLTGISFEQIMQRLVDYAERKK